MRSIEKTVGAWWHTPNTKPRLRQSIGQLVLSFLIRRELAPSHRLQEITSNSPNASGFDPRYFNRTSTSESASNQTSRRWTGDSSAIAQSEDEEQLRGGDDALDVVMHYFAMQRQFQVDPDGKRHSRQAGRQNHMHDSMATGQEIVTFTRHGTGVSTVAFSPDGKRVASLGRDGVARVWDVNTAQEIFAFDIGNKNPFPAFLGVAFSPNGKLLDAVSRGQPPFLG